MQIDSLQQNINFRQIKLSESEVKVAQDAFKQILGNPSAPKDLFKIFDIFESHLNNEIVQKQAESSKARKLFTVTLFHKFFKILNNANNKLKPFDFFIDNLNGYIDKYSLNEKTKDMFFKYDYNITTLNETIDHICNSLGMSKEEFMKQVEDNNSNILYYLTIDNYESNINALKKHFKLDDEIVDLVGKNIDIISKPSDAIIKASNYFINLVSIDKSTYKHMIKNNPKLLSLTENDMKNRIKELATFLNVEESRITPMLKQTELLTLPMKYITKNFNSMQEFLKVNKEKMSEIAVMSPSTIKNNFIYTQNDIQKIVDILGISLETFVEKANQMPAIYRITPKKLDNFINYISKALKMTYKEAIDYLVRNLSVLSYRYNNMVINHEENFKFLREELDFDIDSYVEALKCNSWILGESKESIETNLKDVLEIFNVDKKTLRNMVEKNPYILTTKYVDYMKNLFDGSIFFGVDEDVYKQMCIDNPILATKDLKYLQTNIARILAK